MLYYSEHDIMTLTSRVIWSNTSTTELPVFEFNNNRCEYGKTFILHILFQVYTQQVQNVGSIYPISSLHASFALTFSPSVSLSLPGSDWIKQIGASLGIWLALLWLDCVLFELKHSCCLLMHF